MRKDKAQNFKVIKKIFAGLKLSVCMATFLCLCSEKKELLKASSKVADAHEKLQESVQNALDNRKTESSLIRRNADTFLNKLDTFKRLPAVKDKKLKTLIKDMQEATRELIA